jgi:hypothetical protein
MRRWPVAAVLICALSAPALAASTMQMAAPSQGPETPPPTPVGDPDVPPIGLDLFGSDGPVEIPLPIKPAGN